MTTNRLTTVYATDEHVAIRAAGDYNLLVPEDQVIASGSDGVISSGSLWNLTSATINFANQGLANGNVIKLSHQTNRSVYGPAGDRFAVESVSGSTVTLRRLGQPANVGQPAAPTAGLASIIFQACTFYPQIEEASWEINRRYGIDEASLIGKTPANLADQRDLRALTVLMVLHGLYIAKARGGSAQGGEWWAKVKTVKEELDRVEGRISVRWGSQDAPTHNSTTLFSGRIGR